MTLSTPSSGHYPALPTVTRRTLLRAAPAATLGLLPCAAIASSDTAVLALYREHVALMDRLNDQQRTSSEEYDRLYPDLTELEWRLTREPATGMADLAAKVLALTGIRDDFNTIFEPELLAELEAIVAEPAPSAVTERGK